MNGLLEGIDSISTPFQASVFGEKMEVDTANDSLLLSTSVGDISRPESSAFWSRTVSSNMQSSSSKYFCWACAVSTVSPDWR